MFRILQILAFSLAASQASATIIDNINGAAATPHVVWASNAMPVGWYYTPSFTYNLSGIFTRFEPVASGITPTITIQIQTERPVNGGTVLAQGSFQGDSGIGGTGGVTFPPILLTAGTSYFVDIRNIAGMGVNLGSWANDSSGNPMPSNGATTNVGLWYRDFSDGFATVRTEKYSFGEDGFTPVSGAEPILLFEGTPVPEPSTMALLTFGFAGLGIVRRWVVVTG